MADNELLQELARALRPGPVEPPTERVNALRALVTSTAPAAANGARDGSGAAEDGDLLEEVGRALRPGPVEPPPPRLRAVRELVDAPAQPTATAAAAGVSADGDPSPSGDGGGGGEVVDLQAARFRRLASGRLTRMVSGVLGAAAVALFVAVLAVNQLPSALREVAHNVGLPVDSPELSAAQNDIRELELALARRDAAAVAEADAAMLRSTNKLSGEELRELRDRAVRLHVEALAFLRDHPSPEALSDLPTPTEPAPGTGAPSGQAAPSPGNPTGPAPATPAVPPAGSTAKPPPVPTTVPQPPTVRILSVSPRLDARFQVDFEVSGFTLGPGSPYTVHFFFDSGQEGSSYSGPSPWTFPLLNAVKYRTVCAQVADASGVPRPDSGDCKPILLV